VTAMRTPLVHQFYSLFKTPIGWCGIAWSDAGVTRLHLPELNREATERRLKDLTGAEKARERPPIVDQVARAIQRHLAGAAGATRDLNNIALDLGGASAFERRVYDAARTIPWGQTLSYAELAHRAGSPGAARAVGQALSRNPVGIIIPCHRVLSAKNRIGGFSAFGGADSKRTLLELEGVAVRSQRRVDLPDLSSIDIRRVVRHLSGNDSILARTITRVGDLALARKNRITPFSQLAQAIVHQQLGPRAALTIERRVKALLGGFWNPAALLNSEVNDLRACGLSRAKLAALRELAQRVLDGRLPAARTLRRMTDEEVIECLTQIQGIGLWTAQMFLIFWLLRPDVLPAADGGLQKAIKFAYELKGFPTVKQVEAMGEPWRPYRTVAVWYLWRIADDPAPEQIRHARR
jgi:methylated-DNA-[protein]-cysteine S-methyltransferase